MISSFIDRAALDAAHNIESVMGTPVDCQTLARIQVIVCEAIRRCSPARVYSLDMDRLKLADALEKAIADPDTTADEFGEYVRMHLPKVLAALRLKDKFGDRNEIARIINPNAFLHGSPDYYGPNEDLAWFSAAQRVALKTADAILAARPVAKGDAAHERIRHVKRGTEHEVLGEAMGQQLDEYGEPHHLPEGRQQAAIVDFAQRAPEPFRPCRPPLSGQGRELSMSGLGLIRRIVACPLGLCRTFVTADNDTHLWGECTKCGRKSGMISRKAIRAYIEQQDAEVLAKKGRFDV